MEMMCQSSSSNPKSQIAQTYVSKSLEGFRDENSIYELLLVTRFSNIKKLTTPALTIGLNIINSMDADPLPPSIPQLILPNCDDVKTKSLRSKQSASELKDMRYPQVREFPSSSIDPSEGDISETRSFSGMSETNAVFKFPKYSKISENNNHSKINSNKPKGIVVGVKRKPNDKEPESPTSSNYQKLTYESGWDRTERSNTAVVDKKRLKNVHY